MVKSSICSIPYDKQNSPKYFLGQYLKSRVYQSFIGLEIYTLIFDFEELSSLLK